MFWSCPRLISQVYDVTINPNLLSAPSWRITQQPLCCKAKSFCFKTLLTIRLHTSPLHTTAGLKKYYTVSNSWNLSLRGSITKLQETWMPSFAQHLPRQGRGLNITPFLFIYFYLSWVGMRVGVRWGAFGKCSGIIYISWLVLFVPIFMLLKSENSIKTFSEHFILATGLIRVRANN